MPCENPPQDKAISLWFIRNCCKTDKQLKELPRNKSEREALGMNHQNFKLVHSINCQVERVRAATEKDYRGLAELGTVGKNGKLGIENAMLKAGAKFNAALAAKASPEAKAEAKRMMRLEIESSKKGRTQIGRE